MPLLELRGISKRFGPVEALQDVDLTIGDAEAVGLIGDNGAGKSTLVKILAGVYAPSAGEIRLAGREFTASSPSAARRLGIEMIYQDLALCDDLDVAANIFLFVPWGFLTFMALSPKRPRAATYVMTVVAGALFALGVNAWQASLPTAVGWS